MREEIYAETLTARSPAFLFRRVSWGAIFAGVIVTIVIQLTLTLLGVAIGASTIDPLKESNPTQGLAIGSGIWLLVTGLISLFIGAFVAGRLCGGPRQPDGMLHGVVTWSVSTLVTLFAIASTAGMVLGGLGSLIGNALQTGAQVGSNPQVQEQAKSGMSKIESLLQPTGRSSQGENSGNESNNQAGNQTNLTGIAATDPQIASALFKMEKQGGAASAQSERDEIVNQLTSQHGMTEQQASDLVTQWDQNFQAKKQQFEQKARETGDVAARKTSQGAWWGFGALVLGLVVSAWAGWVGTGSLPTRFTETRSTTTTSSNQS
jgi:hypothetical protein